MSQSSYGVVKSKCFQSSQPLFQPSAKTASIPCSAAKRIYRSIFSVVAPCLGPCSQVMVFICMPHQIPMNFIGRIHEVSSILQGSLRFNIIREATMSCKVLVSTTIRHGVLKGVSIYALTS